MKARTSIPSRIPRAKMETNSFPRTKQASAPFARIMLLQRMAGNQAVQRLFAGSTPGLIIQRQNNEKGQPSTPHAGAFAAEEPALRTRRLAVITAARNAITRLTGALSGGYLWSFESSTGDRIDIAHPSDVPFQETRAQRESRLRQMAGDLIQMAGRLEMAPIASAWLNPTARFKGGTLDIGGFPQPWQDTAMFYAHLSGAIGRDMEDVSRNLFYMNTDPIPSRQIARAVIRSGIGLGIYIVIPDPDNEPLVYHHLTPYEKPMNQMHGIIGEVWHDDFGYYYPYKGQKHYLPGKF